MVLPISQDGFSTIPPADIDNAICQAAGTIAELWAIVAEDNPETLLFVSLDREQSGKQLCKLRDESPGKAFTEYPCAAKITRDIIAIPSSVLTAS